MLNSSLEEFQKPVVRVDTDEKSIRYKWEDEASKLNQNIGIVSIDEYNQVAKSESSDLILPRNVEVGSVLMRHPFCPNKYIPLEDAEMAIYKDKMFCMSSIALRLGLVFDWNIELVEVCNREIKADGSIKIGPKIKMDSSFKSSEESKYKSLMSMYQNVRVNASSNVSPQEEYEEAWRLAHQYGLDSDTEVRSLLEGRNPSNRYIIDSRTVSLELSREINTMYDIACNLQVLRKIFSFSANLQDKVSKKKTLKLVMNLRAL